MLWYFNIKINIVPKKEKFKRFLKKVDVKGRC